MNHRRGIGALLALSVVQLGCGEAPQTSVEIPLLAVGAAVSEIAVSDELTLSLERADVVVGPLYLCPGAQAGELCDSARLEWLDSAIIDGVDGRDQSLGKLTGVSGAVRSWMFDYGVTSLLTQEEPLVSPAALALGGVSAVFEEEAEVLDQVVPFALEVYIAQGEEAERGVQVVRKSSSEVFSHEVTGEEEAFVIEIDPSLWLSDLRSEDFVSSDSCTPGGPALVCSGSVEETCDADGAPGDARDCADLDQVCVPDQGCADRLHWDKNSDVARRVALAMVSGARPRLFFR